MFDIANAAVTGALALLCTAAIAQGTTAPAKAPYDPALAKSLGADERGMRQYVLVILKTGPNRIPAGPERDEMFKGHFANMSRLASEGKLAVAGPFGGDGKDGWRGLYVFAVPDVEQARQLTATDPVVIKGEMVAEFHPFYGSAALMQVPSTHEKITKP